MNLFRANPGTILLLSMALIIGLGACTTDEAGRGGETASEVPVQVARVEIQDLQQTVSAIGSVRADETVVIQPEVTGIIRDVRFREGDRVNRDDVLFKIEHGKLLHQYQARKSALEEARAQLENARKTYQRQEELFQRELNSEQDLDNAREAFDSARARVERLNSEVQEAEERLEDATIRSPFDGIAGAREVDEGNLVQPGQSLVTLYKTDRVEVSFTVPERYVGQIQTGQSVRVNVTSLPGQTFRGEVFFVSPSVREQTRDLQVKAHVQNPDNLLKPGAFARVELVLETRPDRPVVPADSLIATRGGYIVFVVEDGKTKRRSVTIGLRKPGVVEIQSGLSQGEVVVQAGHQSVSEGTEVNVVNKEQINTSGRAIGSIDSDTGAPSPEDDGRG